MKKRILVVFISLMTGVYAFAQNNGGNCTRAIVIQPSATAFRVDSMITGAATFSNIDPFPTKAIWYKYTPTTDGLMTVSTCGGGADSRLILYTGTCGQLALAGFNDDFCDDGSGDPLAAKIDKPVKANVTYYMEFDNAWDDVPFTFTLSLATFTPRPTQACATATVIAPGFYDVDSLFGYASHGNASRANWYKYTPTRNGKIGINSCGFDADARLWVYKGTCAALVPFAESDDDCISGGVDMYAVSLQNIAVVANTTYYFEFDDGNEDFPFQFTFTFDAANSVADDKLSQSVVIAPNPAVNMIELTLNLEKTSDISVNIRNIIGQTVLSQKMQNVLRGSQPIDISALKQGIYMVEVSDGTAKTNKKLVISSKF